MTEIPTDQQLIAIGVRMADAARAVLENDGSEPAWKLMGELIAALSDWDEAMQARYNTTLGN